MIRMCYLLGKFEKTAVLRRVIEYLFNLGQKNEEEVLILWKSL